MRLLFHAEIVHSSTFQLNFFFKLPDVPDKPGKPEIIDYDNQSASLKWAKPENDGGRPILNYIVEVKDKLAADWKECGKTNGPTAEFKVEDLKEKNVYQFRVRAVNKAGTGDASEPTDNHLCKHKNRKNSKQHA